MSTSPITPDTSAIWRFYQHPTPPLEPPDFSQFVTRSGSQATATDGSTKPAGSPDSGRAKIGADLKSLLLDLQSGRPASATAASPAGTGPSGTSEAGSGDVTSDLKTLFSDLQSTQGSQGGHHRHHDAPPPSDASQVSTGTAPTALAAADSTVAAATPQPGLQSSPPGDLLGYLSKALQTYTSQNSSGLSLSTQSSLTLSA